MRLWSLNPSNLDKAGLGAAWREGLLAQKVLLRVSSGESKVGYSNHPQLDRFKALPHPLQGVCDWLWGVHNEAASRGYNYDSDKILLLPGRTRVPVNRGQLMYEADWLRTKLSTRDPSRHVVLTAHPIFEIVEGPVEPWERV